MIQQKYIDFLRQTVRKHLQEDEVKVFIYGSSLDERRQLLRDFEYTVELFWKTLKIYLFEKNGVEVQSPKLCMRECLNSKLFTDEEASYAIDMIDDRNLSIHTDSETKAKAKGIAPKAERDAEFMQEILKKITKDEQ